MFERNDKALLTTRIIVMVVIGIFVAIIILTIAECLLEFGIQPFLNEDRNHILKKRLQVANLSYLSSLHHLVKLLPAFHLLGSTHSPSHNRLL